MARDAEVRRLAEGSPGDSVQTSVRALASRIPIGIVLGARGIAQGDEHRLLPAELASMRQRPLPALRQSGAARAIARELLHGLEATELALPRGAAGMPVWPQGFIGSLAHDDDTAMAAAARSATVRSIGVDIEPALPLPAELADIVATPADGFDARHGDLATRVLFSAKEAVFKAVFPLDRDVLGFDDIAVDLRRGAAFTAKRAGIHILTEVGAKVISFAYVA